jgi:hypothetical protein
MQLVINAGDQVLGRYGNQLAALGEGKARTAMSQALNHEGDKGRTRSNAHSSSNRHQIRRHRQSNGDHPLDTGHLDLPAQGARTGNQHRLVRGTQRGKGVSAAPWNKRRIFKHAFIVPRFGRAFIRTSNKRLDHLPRTM